MDTPLSRCPLFFGLAQEEISSLLHCLTPTQQHFRKGEAILSEGTITDRIGIVLSGLALLSFCDIWGSNHILGSVQPGSVFAEVYACIPQEPLMITVSAAEDTTVLFLQVGRILSTCSTSCPYHSRLILNLLSVCAHKSLHLSQKILHTSSKTIRGRLMSYFSLCAKRSGRVSFHLPYNRQQLADYLSVERSALCNELSKMQRDGLIRYQGRDVELTASEEFL